MGKRIYTSKTELKILQQQLYYSLLMGHEVALYVEQLIFDIINRMKRRK
jgi:hypothetical protein